MIQIQQRGSVMHQKLHTKCTVMERRTMTMDWEGLLDDDDDDRFFESFDRLSSAVPIDLASSGSDDDEGDDSRTSFASAMSSAPIHNMRGIDPARAQASMLRDFNMWMAEPGSIKERRRRLLQGMGLSSNKNLLSRNNTRLKDSCSKRMNYDRDQPSTMSVNNSSPLEDLKLDTSPSPSSTPIFLIRSRSDGDIESFSANTRKRKEEFIGNISKQRLTRTSSMLVTPHGGICQYANTVKVSPKRSRNRSSMLNSAVLSSILSDGQFGAFFLIKNLDTGKEFIVKEFNDDGMWNRLSEVQTGKQLTMEEFEKCVGYSPVVKELMRRENVSRSLDDARKINTNSYLSKRFRNSKRRGVALLKNIKGVANSMSGLIVDKERDHSIGDQRTNKNSTNKWIKVRQHGKSIKEFTALHLCQEIQAHEGSIWTMRFNPDGHYLASAGEDRVIHVWEVQECEVTSVKPYDDYNSVSSTPLHPMARSMSDRPSSFTEISPMPSERRKERPHLAELSPMLSERRKRGKGSTKKKGNLIPDYVHVPETVFSLSERPVCSFTGHLDDVLDLSWSKSHVSFSPRLIKLVEPMGSFPSLLTRAEEQTLITMDILLSLLPFFRPRFKGGSKIASKAQTPDRERERVSGGRETTEMEKSKAEDSKPLATVKEIQRRLVRPPSLHSQSSTSSSTRPRNDDITSSESSSSTKRLEDYLDPILLSAIRAKIGGKRGLGGEMREKKEVEEFEWPVDELKVLMREAVELGDDDDGGVDVIGGVVGDDDDGVCWSPFQRFERTALKRFKGGVKDKQGMGEG